MIPKPLRKRGLGIFVVSMFISPERTLIKSDDGGLAFVTARAAGTLSIFDAHAARLGEVATGQAPVDVA